VKRRLWRGEPRPTFAFFAPPAPIPAQRGKEKTGEIKASFTSAKGTRIRESRAKHRLNGSGMASPERSKCYKWSKQTPINMRLMNVVPVPLLSRNDPSFVGFPVFTRRTVENGGLSRIINGRNSTGRLESALCPHAFQSPVGPSQSPCGGMSRHGEFVDTLSELIMRMRSQVDACQQKNWCDNQLAHVRAEHLERVYGLGVRCAGCGIGMGCKAQSAANGPCHWQGLQRPPQRFPSPRPHARAEIVNTFLRWVRLLLPNRSWTDKALRGPLRLNRAVSRGSVATMAQADAGPAPTSPTPPAGATPTPASATRASAPAGVSTGLGAKVDAIAAKSPTLQQNLKYLDDLGWNINYGPSNGGSHYNKDTKNIVIDSNHQIDPIAAARALSHEIGHAMYSYQYQYDYSSRTAYINSRLADEGAATMKTIQIQREIKAVGGPNIGEPTTNFGQYNKIYDQYLRDEDAVAARRKIGVLYGTGEMTSNTMETYEVYYGKLYDRQTTNTTPR
jgi:hypothetical protein